MKKAGTPKKPKLTKEVILNQYINNIMEGKEPKNIFLFAKELGITESEFYRFYNSFEGIENHFFEVLFDKTLETVQKSSSYSAYPAREKLLSFYFTFFGNLTQNRSFVLYLLPHGKLENLRKLKGLHHKFTAYISAIEIDKPDLKSQKLERLQDKTMKEGAWIQLVSILKFWIHDQSADFEKTDILIEKSVHAGFELINTKPLQSVLDLGKFLLKEMNPVG